MAKTPRATLPGAEERAAIDRSLATLGLPADAATVQRLFDHLSLLCRWNATYNLTAVRDPAQMVALHLADCLAAVPPLARWAAGRPLRLLDVGSGGGLPGGVMAALLPEVQVSCIDTVGKKAAFIRQLAAELQLPNLKALHGRVEQVTDTFDVITSRAFAALTDFTRWTRQALAPDGVWLALKGQPPADEIAALREVDVFHVEQLAVPDLDAARCLVWMRPVP